MNNLYITGNGLVGKELKKHFNYMQIPRVDLRVQDNVDKIFKKWRPEYVINAAAVAGGIKMNVEQKSTMIYHNIQIQTNLIGAAQKYGVKKFIYLGSSCVYPASDKIIKEEDLGTGTLEHTNKYYASAKVCGIDLCRAFNDEGKTRYTCLMPCNLYGENDNWKNDDSHVIPALIRKIHKAKQEGSDVEVWGTGKPLREFMHVKDLSTAIEICLKNDTEELLNVGTGLEISIYDLVMMLVRIIGFKGRIKFNGKMDGVKRKLMDSSKMRSYGWKPKIELEEGLKMTYEYYKQVHKEHVL